MFESAKIGEDDRMSVCKEKSCPQRIRFGKNLKGIRNRLKLTQEAVAEKAGMSTRYIQNLEAGDNFPALQILIRLKTVLGCSWDAMFDRCERTSK